MERGYRPEGTVTFLFSDIEGSTKLWETQADSMRVALARHDALMHSAIAQNNGYVFKTIGDAFCAAFSTACAAVQAALAAQTALATEPWPQNTRIRVRIAIHSGAVESRDDDYFGPPVNRVARILATAHGGQSVLSQTTYNLVRDSLPPHASVLDLGSHQLKDLARPELIFQIHAPGLPTDFPQLRSLSNHPNNLPQQLNNFIGREIEGVQVQALLTKSRLVTLIGSGGTGKTRLALQVAANSLDEYPQGAWLIELASLSDPNLVARTVADALGIQDKSGVPSLEILIESLRHKGVLILLDNCEHVLDASAKLVDALLRVCPGVHVMATSRESLGISGEQTYVVPPLTMPDPAKPHSPESLSQFESVRLFIDRAILSRPDFQVTNQNAPAVASLCLHLDGIPLAIELAAARLRSLSVEEIDAKLDHRFRLLTGGSRTALPRQQTLRALIDWSYDLLNETEKVMLQRVAIFAGGWSIDAAEDICGDIQIQDWEILDYLTSLSDKSLVILDHRNATTRYRLLESVRQYSLDRLTESGELVELRNRHLGYFVKAAQIYDPKLKTSDQKAAIRWFDIEQDNIRAALDWATRERSESGLHLVASTWYYWYVKPHTQEGRAWAQGMVTVMSDSHHPIARARLLQAAAVMDYCLSDFIGYRDGLARALTLAEEMSDFKLLAALHRGLGVAASSLGDDATAISQYRIAIDYCEKAGEKGYDLTSIYNNLAPLLEGEEALEAFQKVLAMEVARGDQLGVAVVKRNLGTFMYGEGEYESAKLLHQEALKIREEFNARAFIAGSLEGVASCTLAGKNGEDFAKNGTRLLAAAQHIREKTGFKNQDDEEAIRQKTIASIKNILDGDTFASVWQHGYEMPLDEAISIALLA